MILATGFRYSLPFLPQYYDGATYEPHAGSATTVSSFLPLDGTHIRDLYLDQFYLRDPTLAFVGCRRPVLSVVPHLCSFRDAVTLATVTFQILDYTTLALAKVWTNTAKLPSSQTMRALYEKTVEERGGYGKYFLYLGQERAAGKSIYSFLGLSWSNNLLCHSSSYPFNRLVERGSGQVWWQAGSLLLFSL